MSHIYGKFVFPHEKTNICRKCRLIAKGSLFEEKRMKIAAGKAHMSAHKRVVVFFKKNSKSEAATTGVDKGSISSQRRESNKGASSDKSDNKNNRCTRFSAQLELQNSFQAFAETDFECPRNKLKMKARGLNS